MSGAINMSTIIYPLCKHDDIRKNPNDFTSPFDQKNIRVTEMRKKADEELVARGETVCKNCRDGKVVIAKSNRFDDVSAGD